MCSLYVNLSYTRGKGTLKLFFQSISWNTISGAFHETWNTFMKYFYFNIKISFLIFLINKKIEFTEKKISSDSQNLEAVARRCSVKKVFLKIFKNSQESSCARVSFLIKFQASACNFIKKRDSGKGVFLRILWNF